MRAAVASSAGRFGWEMVSAAGEVAGSGLEFVLLGADGRIQFIES